MFQVAEQGSHSELMRMKGLYYNLVQAQTLSDDNE